VAFGFKTKGKGEREGEEGSFEGLSLTEHRGVEVEAGVKGEEVLVLSAELEVGEVKVKGEEALVLSVENWGSMTSKTMFGPSTAHPTTEQQSRVKKQSL